MANSSSNALDLDEVASLELCVAVWVKKSFWGNKALITVKGVGGSAATGG